MWQQKDGCVEGAGRAYVLGRRVAHVCEAKPGDCERRRKGHMYACDDCIHGAVCGYFDLYDNALTSQENFEKHCVGCCCGDGSVCNRWNGTGIFCSNWEDGTEPLMG